MFLLRKTNPAADNPSRGCVKSDLCTNQTNQRTRCRWRHTGRSRLVLLDWCETAMGGIERDKTQEDINHRRRQEINKTKKKSQITTMFMWSARHWRGWRVETGLSFSLKLRASCSVVVWRCVLRSPHHRAASICRRRPRHQLSVNAFTYCVSPTMIGF